MDYALEERIGNQGLFTGRKEELSFYLKWINDIKERKSQSTAMLAFRKIWGKRLKIVLGCKETFTESYK